MLDIPLQFPALLDWAFWVPFFFRLLLATQLFREALRLSHGKFPTLINPNNTTPTNGARMGIIGLLASLGAFLLVGLGTQVVGAIVACMFFVRSYQLLATHNDQNISLRELFILAGFVALSLLFLGPGPYSIDLPL